MLSFLRTIPFNPHVEIRQRDFVPRGIKPAQMERGQLLAASKADDATAAFPAIVQVKLNRWRKRAPDGAADDPRPRMAQGCERLSERPLPIST